MWKSLGRIVQKPELIFLALASTFGVFSAFVVPQLSIPDENMHFLRSYSMSTGRITGDSNGYCVFPKDIYDRAYSIYEGDYSSHYAQRVNFNVTVNKPCGTASSYSPFIYIPQAIGFFISHLIWPSTGLMILLGRLVSLAFFITATYFIIKKTQVGKWAFTVIALFPTVIQQAASLSADNFTYVTLFTMAAYLFNLAIRKKALSKRNYVYLILLSSALILIKIPDVLLIMFVLFLPHRLFSYRFKHVSIFLKPLALKIYTVIVMGLFAAITLFIWQHIFNQPLLPPSTANPIPGQPWKFIPILFHTYIYMDPKQTTFGFTGLGGFGDFLFSGAVGSFASYRYWLPEILIFVCYTLLILTLLKPNRFEDRVFKKNSGTLALGSVVTLGIVILGISYSLYIIWALPLLGPSAIFVAGLQGRYFTDLFVLLIPIGIWLRKFIHIAVKTDILYSYIISFTSTFLLLFYAMQTLYAIHLGFF